MRMKTTQATARMRIPIPTHPRVEIFAAVGTAAAAESATGMESPLGKMVVASGRSS